MTDHASRNRRFLALWFPFLPLDRLRMFQPSQWAPTAEATALPAICVEKQRGALRLVAVDPLGLSLGLEVGMTLADARVREPDVRVFDCDPHADQDLLERLCDGAVRYTPMASLDPPHGLVLEVTGCAHLFDGEDRLAEEAAGRLEQWGFHVRHALGSTPEAAHALARFQTAPAADEEGAIRRLPVAALELDEESELALRRAGLKTVGDVAARPPSAFAARFGSEAVDAIERLLGRGRRPLDPRRVPPPIQVERIFAEPVGKVAYAMRMLKELTGEAMEALAERGQGGRRFEAIFFRTDGLAFPLRVETSLPTRDAKAVMRLLRERIDALADPLDPGFGFDMLRLSVRATEKLAPGQLALDGEDKAAPEKDVAGLVDALSTRVGRRRVRRMTPVDTHIPEQAQLLLPAVEARPPAQWEGVADAGDPPMRPLHLFDPPQRIDVVAEVPDGPPHRFRWRRNLHEVLRFEGPERIAHEWWKDRKGRTQETGPERDYYRVEDARGRRYWIFRRGLYGEAKGEPDWFVHGLFA